MEEYNYCSFCRMFTKLKLVKRIIYHKGDNVFACPECRSKVYFDLAVGQFFEKKTNRYFKRDLTVSRYLPVQFAAYMRYERLLQHAIQKEKYEAAKLYKDELDSFGLKYGIFNIDKMATTHQQEALHTLNILEDYLFASDELGKNLDKYPILKVLQNDGRQKAFEIKKALEKGFEAANRLWEWNQQIKIMQRRVEIAIKQVLKELKDRLQEGETSLPQIAALLPEPVPSILRAYLNGEINELPENLWKYDWKKPIDKQGRSSH